MAWDHASDLLMFAQLASDLSFTRTAKVLGVSRSVVSKRIARLEDRLGVRLVNRTTRRLSLTEAGRLLQRHCSDIAGAVEGAEAALRELRTLPQGELKVSAPVFLGQPLTRQVLPPLLAAYPDLRLNLELSDSFVDVVGGGYDAVIRIGVLADSSLVAHRIADTRLVLCAAPRYLARRGVPRHPGELTEHDCIALVTASGTVDAWRFDDGGRPFTVKVRSRLRTDNDVVIQEALRQGMGIAYVPSLMVREDVAAGRLQLLLAPFCRQDQGVYVLYPHRRHVPPKVRVFVDHVAERLGTQDPERPSGTA